MEINLFLQKYLLFQYIIFFNKLCPHEYEDTKLNRHRTEEETAVSFLLLLIPSCLAHYPWVLPRGSHFLLLSCLQHFNLAKPVGILFLTCLLLFVGLYLLLCKMVGFISHM